MVRPASRAESTLMRRRIFFPSLRNRMMMLGGASASESLTVSDSDAQAPSTVIIRFLSEGKKIRLRINVDSARDAGLTISSKLLRPADVVGSPGNG